MAIPLARIAYTRYQRQHTDPAPLPLANNAYLPVGKAELVSNSMDDSYPWANDMSDSFCEYKEAKDVTYSVDSDSDSTFPLDQSEESLPGVKQNIALYPQYLTKTPTTIIIDEVNLPKLNSSFNIHTAGSNEPLFQVQRERPSFTGRQILIDAKTQVPVMTVRRVPGSLPVSYTFTDAKDTKILALNGNFFVPTQGSKATAILTNAMSMSEAKLTMQGSWRNRHAVISNNASGEILATMSSELLNVKNVIGHRRTYTVRISPGVDMALIVGMIVALDARSS